MEDLHPKPLSSIAFQERSSALVWFIRQMAIKCSFYGSHLCSVLRVIIATILSQYILYLYELLEFIHFWSQTAGTTLNLSRFRITQLHHEEVQPFVVIITAAFVLLGISGTPENYCLFVGRISIPLPLAIKFFLTTCMKNYYKKIHKSIFL